MAIAVPLVAFALVSLLLAKAHGVRYANDTQFFFANADALRAGRLPNVGYLGYTSYVAVLRSVGLGGGAIVFGQWLVSGGVVVAIFDLGRRLSGSLAGSVAATMYALNVDIARFTFYVLSDSLFASALGLAVYAAYRATTGQSRRWTAAAVALGIVMGFARFNGWFMLPFLVEWLIRSSALGPARRWALRAGSGVCYAAFMAAALRNTGSTAISDQLLRGGSVIWNDEASAIAMPAAGPGHRGLPPAVNYALQHPVASAALMARRITTEAWHTRRFYSRAHNMAIVATMPLLYGLAAVGCWVYRRAPVSRVCLMLFSVDLLLVALTAADWDGRYLVMVLPIVTLWSGIGAASLWAGASGASGWRPAVESES